MEVFQPTDTCRLGTKFSLYQPLGASDVFRLSDFFANSFPGDELLKSARSD